MAHGEWIPAQVHGMAWLTIERHWSFQAECALYNFCEALGVRVALPVWCDEGFFS